MKKHYGRWMDIVRSLELESFILTKLTKPSILVNLVGPQVSLPPGWVLAVRGNVFFMIYGGPSGGSLLSGGGIIIFHVIRRHFLAATVDPAVSLSTYSPNPMEVVP